MLSYFSTDLSHQNACSQPPVTALAIHDGFILSGHGPFIRVYDHQTYRLLASAQAFEDQAIHGFQALHITQSASSIIVWGGRLLKIVSITSKSKQDEVSDVQVYLDLKKTVTVQDWILDVSSRPLHDCPESHGSVWATLVTAHNALYSVKSLERSSSDLQLFNDPSVEPLLAGRKCILYSAHVKWRSSTEILVASGTAFGEIIVWSCSLADKNPSIHTHFSFTGHEGSIFGVQISELIDSPSNTVRRLLTSCSDDRTIRVWDISKIDQRTDASLSLKNNDVEDNTQETGFPVNLPDERDSNCLAVAIGHVSRIWDIRYLYATENGSSHHIVTIISVGEDGTCQSWSLSREAILNSDEPIFKLTHLSTSAHHLGKNIWSVASSEDLSALGKSILVTGGADGRIVSRTPVSSKQMEKVLEERDITAVLRNIFKLPATKPISSEISRKASKATADYFRSYAYVEKNTFLVTTNNGLVLLENLETLENGDISRNWREIDQLDDLKGYSVVASIPDSGLAFLAGANGILYCFISNHNKVVFIAKTEGKIAGIFPCYLESSNPEEMAVLLTYLGETQPRLFQLRGSATGAMAVSEYEFPSLGKELGVPSSQNSSALVCHIQGELVLFLGYRDGKILSFTKVDGGRVAMRSTQAHGQEAVTAMCWVPSSLAIEQTEAGSVPCLGWLFSVGRDGTCAVHEFGGHPAQFLLVHKLTLPFGPNIEGVYLTPSAKDVYVYGFHGRQFVVYNISASNYILSIECGGAHRMWTFDPQFNPTGQIIGGNLAWTKASKLKSCNVLEPNHGIVQHGGHGREIKACAVSTSSNHSLGPLIATGAEDTDICLFQFNNSSLSCISTLRKHVTGIQALQWSTDGSYLFSCGGYEEFFIWRVRAVPGMKVGIVFESSCPVESERPDLRIMGFALKKRHSDVEQSVNETEESEFEIAMVYSNSVTKVL
jgi:WD40 repeat protein